MNREEFEVFLNKEYEQYGTVAKEILTHFDELESQEHQDFYIEHIREHHNNAFGTKSDWEVEIDSRVIAKKINGDALEVLGQLVESPKFDGDVVSKAGKSELYHYGLAVRIANNNEFGDNAATYLGWKVWQLRKFK